MTKDLVELRLNGTLLETLVENGHILGWPANVSAERVDPWDSDGRLHRATARWYVTATTRRIGKGHQHTSPVTGADAATILNYLESVAEALFGGDAQGRADARRIISGIKSSISHLRRAGVPVTAESRGKFIVYSVNGASDE